MIQDRGLVYYRSARRNSSFWCVISRLLTVVAYSVGVALDAQEISDALKLRLPPDGDPRSATDRPRTLSEVRNVVEFLVKMDELVWRRSEYGANRGVFDSKNILAVEDHIRLWERIARGHSPE